MTFKHFFALRFKNTLPSTSLTIAGAFTLLLACIASPTVSHAAEIGVTENAIVVGGVLDLKGQSRGLGIGMKTGIEAAFKGQEIQGKRIQYVTLNDSYTPSITEKSTRQLIDEGIFAMLGNVGTPTAKVSLPLLAEANVPAVGFFTGAGLLRPGKGNVVNYRASYIQEAASVINQAISNGVKATEICAYVQNDAYGMAGVQGIKMALAKQPRTRKIIKALDQLLAKEGENPERNNIGPVGVYQRNTLSSRAGYDSLKQWEQQQNTECKLVVSVGTYNAIGRFAGYSRYKDNDWMISAVSFTGADNLKTVLSEFGVTDRIIITQVVPELDSSLAIVRHARRDLGDRFGYVSLEGYIVGKMFLHALGQIDGDITRDRFLAVIQGKQFKVDGLALSFSRSNQGSDLVTMTYFSDNEFTQMAYSDWQ